jgi:hypothetical protein
VIVNVHMADGAVFQLASRNDLRTLTDRDPANDDAAVVGFYRERPGSEWRQLRMAYIRRGQIAWVANAVDEGDSEVDVPAARLAEERHARWVERQEAHDPAQPATEIASA